MLKFEIEIYSFFMHDKNHLAKGTKSDAAFFAFTMSDNAPDLNPAAPSFSAGELAQLQCPFQPPDGTACAQQATANGCVFGHRCQVKSAVGEPSSDQQELAKLRTIPSHFCLNRILGRCSNPEKGYTMAGNELYWCSVGLHPRNLQDFDRIVEQIRKKKIRINDNSCCQAQGSSSYGAFVSAAPTQEVRISSIMNHDS